MTLVSAQDKAVIESPAVGIKGGLGETLARDDRHQCSLGKFSTIPVKTLPTTFAQADNGLLPPAPRPAFSAPPTCAQAQSACYAQIPIFQKSHTTYVSKKTYSRQAAALGWQKDRNRTYCYSFQIRMFYTRGWEKQFSAFALRCLTLPNETYSPRVSQKITKKLSPHRFKVQSLTRFGPTDSSRKCTPTSGAPAFRARFRCFKNGVKHLPDRGAKVIAEFSAFI